MEQLELFGSDNSSNEDDTLDQRVLSDANQFSSSDDDPENISEIGIKENGSSFVDEKQNNGDSDTCTTNQNWVTG